jgi:hypothetical protein
MVLVLSLFSHHTQIFQISTMQIVTGIVIAQYCQKDSATTIERVSSLKLK